MILRPRKLLQLIREFILRPVFRIIITQDDLGNCVLKPLWTVVITRAQSLRFLRVSKRWRFESSRGHVARFSWIFCLSFFFLACSLPFHFHYGSSEFQIRPTTVFASWPTRATHVMASSLTKHTPTLLLPFRFHRLQLPDPLLPAHLAA
jgi:hypothetical protein